MPSINYSRRTALYRLFDAEEQLLYVGITFNLRNRWNGHSSKPWWKQVVHREVEWYENRHAAEAAEAVAILAEGPLYNIAGAEQSPAPMPPKPKRVRSTHHCDIACKELTAAGRRWRNSKAALKESDAELRAVVQQGRQAGMTVRRLAKLTGFTREWVAKIAPAPKS